MKIIYSLGIILLGTSAILYADIDLSLIPIRKALIDTTGRDTRWDILSLNVYDGAYVPYRELGQPEMAEREEPAPFTDLMGSMERITSKLDALANRIEGLTEKDIKGKK